MSNVRDECQHASKDEAVAKQIEERREEQVVHVPVVPAAITPITCNVSHTSSSSPLPPFPFTVLSSSRELAARALSALVSASESGEVVMYDIQTFQGRVIENLMTSANGCSVIAPLVAMWHLRFSGGIADHSVREVIDSISLQLLVDIRRKLRVSKGAFLNPTEFTTTSWTRW